MKTIISVCLLCTVFMSACMYDASNQPEADQLVHRYHTALKAENWDAVLALYNPVFFKERNRKGWRVKLLEQQKKYGTLQHVRQTYSQKDPRYSGDFYIYGYTLIFERGTVAETLTIFKGLQDNALGIVGHTLKAKKHSG
ncbi:MAG: hypothetical protein Q9M09_01215 [Mariprofundaceae bacterium]|nr:hypothetical protein [Mariprofundaceae bacterium]